MTSTELRMPSDILKKYGAEIRPSAEYKRTERLRSIVSSFEDITESEEEEEVQVVPTTSEGRSPHVQSASHFLQKRSHSLTRSTQSNPTLSKRPSPPVLTRGRSDPQILRRTSFSLFKNSIQIHNCSELGPDTILSPIQEVASPLFAPPTFSLFSSNAERT